MPKCAVRGRSKTRPLHFTVFGVRSDLTFFVWGRTMAVSRARAVSNVHHHSPEFLDRRLKLRELPFTPVACGLGESPLSVLDNLEESIS